MGPLNTNYQAEPAVAAAGALMINHFSHHHPLHLSHHHHPQTPCSACTHPTSAPAYGCQHCNFYLHVSCSQMPQQLQHPFDSNKTHSFRLLPKPVYPEGKFGCDACGHHGSGFSYHCADCRIDLHILCAALPTVACVSSHQHQLTLAFAPPYPNNQFMCDVCAKPGSKTWLYHCRTCLYDVHLGCASGPQKPVPRSVQHFNQRVQPVMGQPAASQAVPVSVRPGRGPQIVNPMIEGALNGISSAVAQNFTNLLIGGGGGGGGAVDYAGGFGGVDYGSGGGEVYYE